MLVSFLETDLLFLVVREIFAGFLSGSFDFLDGRTQVEYWVSKQDLAKSEATYDVSSFTRSEMLLKHGKMRYIILIPLPLFFAHTIFGVRGLSAWVIIGIIWAFCSAITVVIYPLYESREAILMVTRGLLKVC